MEISQDKVWWNNITGPARYKNAIVESLRSHQHVILFVQANIPWRHQLRFSVEGETKSNDDVFSYIDYEDQIMEDTPFLKQIIDRYAEESVARKYREGVMKAHEFILDHEILKNKVIWIKGIPEDKIDGVIKDITLYANESGMSKNAGRFLVEVRNSKLKRTQHKRIAVIGWEEYISTYDTLLFAHLMASKKDIKIKLFQSYLAHVSAEICGYDSEICLEFLEDFRVEKDDPLEVFREMSDRYQGTGRGEFQEELTQQHPFYYLHNNQIEKIRNSVWKAQVQVLFPYIEEYRILIIDKWKDSISQCLPIKDAFHESIENPVDVELGTMFHLLHHGLVLDMDTEKAVRLLYKVRNKLAHLDICDSKEINELLTMSF